jgi:hypothetical protein
MLGQPSSGANVRDNPAFENSKGWGSLIVGIQLVENQRLGQPPLYQSPDEISPNLKKLLEYNSSEQSTACWRSRRMSAESNALGNINEFLRTIPYAITGQWFYAQNIFLDGFSFTRCRFDGCNVYLARGMFVLDHCYFHNCTFF